MASNPALGTMMMVIAGFCSASFYIPFRKVRNWSWESYWQINSIVSWLVIPWLVAYLVIPDLHGVLGDAPPRNLCLTFLFGAMWGVGALTFGLTMRYLGMSLGYAVALGLCAAIGTVLPPIFKREFMDLLRTFSGLVILGGVLVSLLGIALCGTAGILKERDLSTEQKQATISEFNFVKGMWVALFCAIMSACMVFAFESGKPIADLAVQRGTRPELQNVVVLLVLLPGAFVVNSLYCVFLNLKNRTMKEYANASQASLVVNYAFSACAGAIWYVFIMLYGMSRSQMGKYDFATWSTVTALIIVFSNMWGFIFKEWRGTSRLTHRMIFTGILALLASTIIIGYGTYLGTARI